MMQSELFAPKNLEHTNMITHIARICNNHVGYTELFDIVMLDLLLIR